jgi:transposase
MAERSGHRAREQLVGQRTALLNALRGHLSEIGMVTARGAQNAYRLKRVLTDGVDEDGVIQVPKCVRMALAPLAKQIDALDAGIETIDKELAAEAKADEKARRLMSIPRIGPVTASAIAATVPDMSAFASGREFSAFLGLTPRQHSSGGKERLGRITKMGDRYIRKLLVVGATAVLHHATGHNDPLRRWAKRMLDRKGGQAGFKLTAVALANKLARIVFALLRTGEFYDDRPVAA